MKKYLKRTKTTKNHNNITYCSSDRVRTSFLPILGHFCSFTPFLAQKIKIFEKQKKNKKYYHFTYSQVSNKLGDLNKCEGRRVFLNLTKRGSKKMRGSKVLNETLSILLLLFDVREQLLIRKKSFSTFLNRTCHENVTKRFVSKLGISFWVILGIFLLFYPINNLKETF